MPTLAPRCDAAVVSESVPLMQFSSLNLSARLLETLASEGYETPTPIQAQAIPPVLEGRDLLGCAQTGTGKTAAFALPLIERLLAGGAPKNRDDARLARALVLAPTRELAAQIEESLRTYGRRTGLRHTAIYGGVKQFRQVRQLQAGVDVIVATPGRLLDLMEQGYVDLSAIEVFVLDEADRMLDMGFIEPIRRIGRALPSERQTLLFSATMPPKIRQLADTMLRDPVSVSVTPRSSAAATVRQTLYHVAGEHKPALLAHLLRNPAIKRTVVFTRTKHGADRLAAKLTRDGVSAGAIHGNKSQGQRERALDAFRSGRSRVLVATDVAARGLDVDGISHVINFNLPNEPEAYVHRIGRTGRAGATGTAISFCARDERGFLRAIEKLTGTRMPTVDVPQDLDSGQPDAPAERPVPAVRPARPAPSEQRQARKTPKPRPASPKQREGRKSSAPRPGKRSAKPGPKRGRRPAARGGAGATRTGSRSSNARSQAKR
ncbi:MAG: DEAD/DEAH box helicase [Phycisphaerales bacterium]